MTIIGLDGKKFNVNLSKYSLKIDDRSRSQLFLDAIEVIKQVYPSDYICAEVYLEGASTKLYLDIYLPARKLAIEVQGEQHFKYTRFMHKNKIYFGQAQKKDKEKKALLNLNNIHLIYFNYNEKNEWKKILVTAFMKTV